ncbi:MAG: tRNA guanosine(34) transglycosylase Tgt [Candidatus Neomarinimicrobiota bacterium]|nr:tRNA guanosine(34) transglycosylase Tgt [Candidatus Neomarinimicrobiota bacterium]
MKIFNLEKTCSSTKARAGRLFSDHGKIETPFFMPVGTYGAVKTKSSEEIQALPSSILLSNTYHLYLRPGTKILEKIGGLHKFMNWNKAILTDSGGFQIFSLNGLRKITEKGVIFKSHLDGSEHYLTPESVIDIQRSIGSDFMMMLDVCPPGDADKKTWLEALEITTRWAKRGMNYYRKKEPKYGYKQILIPIIQGGTDLELRMRSFEQLIELNAEAYAIGGLAVGEPKTKMLDTTEYMGEIMPVDKPRYLMGVGTPSDLVKCVARGIDMFDCVMPTRNARNGQLFTANGKINIKNAKYRSDFSEIDDSGLLFDGNQYSKAYLHHLFRTNEVLGLRIASQQNLKFYIYLMKKMREKILSGNFKLWADNFLLKYDGSKI